MPTDLLPYAVRLLPGLLLITGCLALTRGQRDPLLRIALLILGFVLIRDAMTPAGLWRIGLAGGAGTTGAGVPWLRFTDDPAVLISLASATLLLTAAVVRLAPDLRSLVVWGRATPAALVLGAGGGVLAAAPAVALAAQLPAEARGGDVAHTLLPALLFFCLAGNLAEEVLFRGFLQGRLEDDLGPVRAAVLSGVLFAACHAFLASTVTGIGWPLLLFTLYEGLICAFLRLRRGVVPAALAHGTAIFLMSAALV